MDLPFFCIVLEILATETLFSRHLGARRREIKNIKNPNLFFFKLQYLSFETWNNLKMNIFQKKIATFFVIFSNEMEKQLRFGT